MRGSNRFTAGAPLPRFGFGVSPHDAGPAHRFGVCEAMMHVAVHAGVPAANHALKIVKQTLVEMEGGGENAAGAKPIGTVGLKRTECYFSSLIGPLSPKSLPSLTLHVLR
jgi:hypothetical protein